MWPAVLLLLFIGAEGYRVRLHQCATLRGEKGTDHPDHYREVVLDVTPSEVFVTVQFCEIRAHAYAMYATHLQLARRTPITKHGGTDSFVDLYNHLDCHKKRTIKDLRPWNEAVQLIGPQRAGTFDKQHKCYTLSSESAVKIPNPYPDITDPREWGGYLAFLSDRNLPPSATNLLLGHCLCVKS